MNSPTVSTESSGVFIEALYFSAGIRSAFFGAISRPSDLPPIESIGLRNDIYIEHGQRAVDCSRFSLEPGSALGGTAGWLAVYAPAIDVYGPRGVYCGVGVWTTGGRVLEGERTLEALLKLVDVLAESQGSSASRELPRRFSEHCPRALQFIREKCSVGRMPETRSFASSLEPYAQRVYVSTGIQISSGAPIPSSLIHAIDFLSIVDSETLTNLRPATPQVLFICAEEGDLASNATSVERVALEHLFAGDSADVAFLRQHVSRAESHFQEVASALSQLERKTAECNAIRHELTSSRETAQTHQENIAKLVARIRELSSTPDPHSTLPGPSTPSVSAVGGRDFDRLENRLADRLRRDVQFVLVQAGLVSVSDDTNGYTRTRSKIETSLDTIRHTLDRIERNMHAFPRNDPGASQTIGPDGATENWWRRNLVWIVWSVVAVLAVTTAIAFVV
jgi:hypothetical protein